MTVRRAGKWILDRTLVPAVRYAFDPIIAKLIAQIGEAISRLDQTAAKLGSQLDTATLSLVSEIGEAGAHTWTAAGATEQLRSSQSRLRKELAELRAAIASRTPNNPCIHGFKVFAQTDEDGIIENILDRLPDHSRTFIEIGCGNGLENNTHYLLLKNYRGAWVDGSEDSIAFIKNALGSLRFQNLLIKRSVVGSENIASLIDELCRFVGTKEPGFFSLDIDGNDFDVLAQALKYFRPVTICVEYNAKFPPPLQIAIRYDPNHRWAGDDYHGASLQSFCDLLGDYKLVACNLTGVNAFFVRRDCADAFTDYTPQKLYQPFREDLIDLRAEHRPSLKWLKNKLA